MSMLHAVLVATDLSTPARHAAERACRIAGGAGATLTLVHVVNYGALEDLVNLMSPGQDIEQALLDDARRGLHELATSLSRRHGMALREEVDRGPVVAAIARHADAMQADLVVTGTRGTGFLRRFLIGSTADRLLRRAARPLLMVRHASRDDYRRVLVALDFSPFGAPAIRLATAVAPDAHLVLMHAIQVPFEDKMRFAGVDDQTISQYRKAARQEAHRRVEELAAACALPPGTWSLRITEGGDPWMRVIEQEQETDSDLVVIGKHGRNRVEEALLGSTTRMVLAEGDVDVLVVPVAG